MIDRELLDSLRLFGPELWLLGFTTLAVVVDLVLPPGRRAQVGYFMIAGLLVAAIAAVRSDPGAGAAYFSGLLVSDDFARFLKILLAFVTAAAILVTLASDEVPDEVQGELFAMLGAICLGMFLMVAASDLLTLYLGIETVSIASYIAVGLRRGTRAAVEASLKYVLFGAVASGVMLYGLGWIYGATGTTSLAGIREAVASGGVGAGPLFVGIACALAGFGYKVAAVPFHMWAPDVYEGAPTPVTAFLSVGPKIAGFGALVRFFYLGLVAPAGDGASYRLIGDVDWPLLVATLSVLTMTVGNLAAIVQTSVKRMLAYSSVAHAGYMLMPLVALDAEGLWALLFYAVVYFLMNVGAFVVVMTCAQTLGSESFDAFAGYGRRVPLVGVAATVFMVSLTGLPPTAGFIGKLYLFSAVLDAGWYLLALAGALNSVVSLYYYMRLVKTMWFDEPPAAGEAPAPGTVAAPSLGIVHGVLLAAFAAPTLILGIYFGPLLDAARGAARLFPG